MKKILLSVFLGAALSFSANAQLTRNCGTMENLERLKALDPAVETNMQQIEQQVQNIIAGGNAGSRGTIYRIPVVVHVVYNTTSQNISDAQIQSQITILNEDFRRMNADKVNTPSTFTSVAADSEIEFCLASVAPGGAATSGITRTSTAVTAFSADDKVKYTSQGGKDAWDATKYLNIWVCNLGGGLLGYAQFPGGPAATDGVVVGYKYFGNTGTATAPFNKGRTGTHEVGHWLNLRHIWGDASCGDDYVSDTPVHYTSNSSCPSHPKSNSCGTSAEMFMNYMDYTDDACMNLYTTAQASRMRALFASGGARASLLTSGGCGSTTASYCASKGKSTADEWVAGVKVGTINNSTGANGGYADFTSIKTDLAKGTAYTISLTPGFASTAYNEYWRVWIDYNQDKDFDDAGELVYDAGALSSAAVSGTFTVPTGATTGTTRMRVSMKYNASQTSCETFDYGEVEDYSVNITSSTTASYCASKGKSTADEWVAGVKVGTINNSTGANGGYADFTTIKTDLAKGSSYTVSLTPGFASTAYNEYWRVWIDYNQDKDFEDAGELVYDAGALSSAAVSGTFTVPTGATTGTTRMRVSMKYNAAQTSCETFDYGEVEDYSVNITSSSNKTVTVGTGTGTTGIAPYGTYYMDERVQFIITKAELDAAGYSASNNVLKSLAFNVYSASSQTMNGFTIKIRHTTASSLSTSFLSTSGMTTVYQANFTATAGAWNTHTFSTAFSYNGTDNLLIDICWNNSSYTSDSKVYYTSTSAYRTLYKKSDVSSGGICGTTSGTQSYYRPNMKMVFGASTAKEITLETATEEPVAEISEEKTMMVSLSPNPAKNVVNIEVVNAAGEDAVQLDIYDLQGRLVISRGFNGETKLPVSVDALPAGLYQVIVRSGETMKTQKLVVTK